MTEKFQKLFVLKGLKQNKENKNRLKNISNKCDNVVISLI